MPTEAKTSPDVEVLSGSFHDDGWTSQSVEVRVEPEPYDRNIKVTVWNPYFNRAYLDNEVTILVDGLRAFSDELTPCSTAVIERELDARSDMTIELRSEAVMSADTFDPRERAVVLKIEEEAVTPAASASPSKAAASKAS